MTRKRIHTYYGIILAIALIISGLCLINACVGIYRLGAHPFSREAVAIAFDGIDVPVYISLALILGGIILDIAMPLEKEKKPVEKQYGVILERLHRKLDMAQVDPAVRHNILQQQNSRKIHSTITLVLLAACSIAFLFYGANGRNFHQSEINSSMVQAMKYFIPCLVIPFGYGIFTAYHAKYSMQKEIELVKQAIAAGCQTPQNKPDLPVQAKRSAMPIIKSVIAVTAVALLLFGLFNGGAKDVLTKAVNICTECVGLG